MKTMYAETLHYKNDRREREDFIVNVIGLGEVLFEVEEKSRIEGKADTIAKISNTDILTICEKGTDRIITRKIARPNQLRKLLGEENVPTELMKLAIKYKRLGYNDRY